MRYAFWNGLLGLLALMAAGCGASSPAAEPSAVDVPSAVFATITPRGPAIPGDVATIQALASLSRVTPSGASTLPPTAPATLTGLPATPAPATAAPARTATSPPTPIPSPTLRPAPTAIPAPRTIGRAGGGNGEFAYPTGIVVTANALYVADRDNGRVQRLTLQGDFVWKAGAPGTNPGQLSVPHGIAVFNKLLYVADTGNKRISVFSAETGSFIRVFGERGADYNQLAGPYAISIDSNGHVFVSDKGNFRIQGYNSDDSPLRMSGSGGATAGNFSGLGPAGLANIGDTLFVADTSRDLVDMFDGTGKYFGNFGSSGDAPGRLKAPVGVTADSAGRVIVADKDNMRVSIFAANGNFIEVKPVGLGTEPTFVAVDAAGIIYVTDVKNNRVVVLQ